MKGRGNTSALETSRGDGNWILDIPCWLLDIENGGKLKNGFNRLQR